MDLSAIPIEWITAGGAFAFGLLFAGLCCAGKILKLERQNAELTAQVKNEKAALEHTTATLDNRFKVTAQEALKSSSEQFLQLAQEKLKAAQADNAHDLDKRQKAIETMVKPVEENLKHLNAAVEQVKGTDKALREDLNLLSKETAKLVGVLRDPSAQGQWGEYILEGILEKSGLMKGVHYETQKALEGSSQRPDAIINMQDGFKIIIDSKAPLNDVAAQITGDLSEEDHNRLMQNIAKAVREHVKALGKKGYWENLDSPDFTVMFLPSEHLYSMALRADPSIVDFASSNNVIIASPTLLMSLLRVVGMSWRQVELAQNAQEIATRGQDLYSRLLTFTTHIEKVGKNLQGAMQGYDSAIGSLEKSVLPAARKFKDLQNAQGTKDLPEFTGIEKQPRPLTLTSEDEDERKRA